MFEFRNILFPVDFSERCIAAAPHVKAIAQRFGAKVTFLYVVEPIQQAGDLAFSPMVFQMELDERTQHYRVLMRSFLQEKFNSLEVHAGRHPMRVRDTMAKLEMDRDVRGLSC